MEAKERIDRLTKQLDEANYRYYVLDDPIMLDFEYDHLIRELVALEQKFPDLASPLSPTQRVGGEALSKFEKVSHPVPLMSLQDVFSLEELDDFLNKIQCASEPSSVAMCTFATADIRSVKISIFLVFAPIITSHSTPRSESHLTCG